MAAAVKWMFGCVFLLCFLCSCHALPIFLRGRSTGGMLGAPRVYGNVTLPQEQWFIQRLDHFNSASITTWKQRYFVNGTFYKEGGPVFLMIGGEGTANPIWMVTGHWINLAQKYRALCLMLEHRYYGKSHPTPDLSTDTLQHLSSEQGLADLAYFRQYMSQKMGLSKSKWISFGGSYPGSLSAWFRLKYPHLVDGAVATSAPLLAQLDFKAYNMVVQDALLTTGDSCVKNIAAATKSLETLLLSKAGLAKIKKTFSLCDDLDPSNSDDISNFFSVLAGNFAGVVQYNKDNREFEGAKGTNITVDYVCGVMNDASIGEPLRRYADVNYAVMKAYSTKCLDFKYDRMIQELQEVDWDTAAAEGGRQWIYQTCTEFGFFQSSDSDRQPFGHHFPASFSVKQCQDIFGAKFGLDLLSAGINATNANYGALGIKITKVVFPNGSIDPWHALGITQDRSPQATAIYIKGTAHCANMYPPSPSDPPQLTQARIHIDKLVGQWISS